MTDLEWALEVLCVMRAWAGPDAPDDDAARSHPLYPTNAVNAAGDPCEAALWCAVNDLLAKHGYPLPRQVTT
jgi:hypothetical protein